MCSSTLSMVDHISTKPALVLSALLSTDVMKQAKPVQSSGLSGQNSTRVIRWQICGHNSSALSTGVNKFLRLGNCSRERTYSPVFEKPRTQGPEEEFDLDLWQLRAVLAVLCRPRYKSDHHV